MADDMDEPTEEEERQRSLSFALGMCHGFEIAVGELEPCFREVKGGRTVADDRRLVLTEILLSLRAILVDPVDVKGPLDCLIREVEEHLADGTATVAERRSGDRRTSTNERRAT